MNESKAMLEALEFYADPFAWKKKHDPEDVVRVPDFYSETSFGDTAVEALAALRSIPQQGEPGGPRGKCTCRYDGCDPCEHCRERSPSSTASPVSAGMREALERCDWPNEAFAFRDEPGEHDPCYVVMPGGAMLPLNHHAGEGVDISRAKFIVAACNAALTGEAERWLAVAKTEAAGRERMSQIAASRLETAAPPSVALGAGREAREKEITRLATIEECTNIAEAIDSGRGNEKEIAKAIRALSRPQSDDANRGTVHSHPERAGEAP